MVEIFFEYIEIHEDKQVKLAAYKLKDSVVVWWEKLQIHRRREGKQSICLWSCMQKLLRVRFLLVNYDQILCNQYKQCLQRSHSVSEYMEENYHLNARVELHES